MDTLISNVTVVTMNEKMDVVFGGFIGITEGKIAYIGTAAPEQSPKTIIDGTGMVAIPGLVNAHTHLATTLLRGYLDDAENREALTQLLQKEAKMDSKCAKASALLGIAECLRFGVTSVSDLYYFPDAVAEAAAEAGIKANIALSSNRFVDESEDFDFETDEQCKELCRVKDKWHGYENGRIKIDCGIHAEYTSNFRLWEGLSAYAMEEDLGMQLHLGQTEEEAVSCEERTGLSQVELLSAHGLFNVPATATGCAALSETDRKILGKKGASAVLTPVSDGKAGRKGADISACVKAGMNVALGTDGAVDCGNLDMFEVMRQTAFNARVLGGDASQMPAPALLMMATVCGARAQGRAAEMGMLKEGMDADIALVDFSAPHLMPCHNVLSSLVFAAKGGDVAMTMVRGKILYQNGQFPTIDLPDVVQTISQYAIPKLFHETAQ